MPMMMSELNKVFNETSLMRRGTVLKSLFLYLKNPDVRRYLAGRKGDAQGVYGYQCFFLKWVFEFIDNWSFVNRKSSLAI